MSNTSPKDEDLTGTFMASTIDDDNLDDVMKGSDLNIIPDDVDSSSKDNILSAKDKGLIATFMTSTRNDDNLDDEVKGGDLNIIPEDAECSSKDIAMSTAADQKMKHKSLVFSMRDSRRRPMSLRDSMHPGRSNVVLQSFVASSLDDGFLSTMVETGDDDDKTESSSMDREPLPYVLIILSVCQYFSSGIINCFPNVFSVDFQEQLNVSASVYGSAFAISKVGSMVAALISPILMRRYGGLRPLLFMSILFMGGSILFSMSYPMENYYVFLIGLLILNLASVFNYLIASTVVGISITDKDSYRIVKMILATVMSCGDISGGYVFPHLGIKLSLCIFVTVSLLNVLVTIYVELISVKSGITPSYQQAQKDFKDEQCYHSNNHCQQNHTLFKSLSSWLQKTMKSLVTFPNIYWYLVLESTLVAGFSVYMNFSIYALDEIYGLSDVQANQIVATAKTMKLLLLIPSSLMLRQYKWLERPIVLIVPALFLFSILPVLFQFSLVRAWVEYICLGLAMAFSRLVSTSLIVPALKSKGKEDLITTGSGHLMIFSSIWMAVTSQVYYSMMELTVQWSFWRDVDFHLVYLINIAVVAIIFIDALFIFHCLPFDQTTTPKPKVSVNDINS